jgi:hypothetical protein
MCQEIFALKSPAAAIEGIRERLANSSTKPHERVIVRAFSAPDHRHNMIYWAYDPLMGGQIFCLNFGDPVAAEHGLEKAVEDS